MGEKDLRALLAEARGVARSVCIAGSLPYAQWSRDQHEADSLIKRIDAALAEPVEGCDRCETLRELADTAAAEQGLAQRRMMEAQAQRDEARAEVEVLRGVGCQTADKAGEEPSGPCGVCRKCAYQRGAEAMRTAAMGAAWHSAAMALYKRIQEMPVPEDRE